MTIYEPGTLAMVTAYNRPKHYRAYFDGKTWRECGDGMFCVDEPTSLRPLVTLDPEDAEQVERLAAAYYECDGAVIDNAEPMSARALAMRHALKSLTRPPKPPEPTGLGAVVEDAEGLRWVRTHIELDAHWRSGDFRGRYDEWRHIDAVRILSDGVQP